MRALLALLLFFPLVAWSAEKPDTKPKAELVSNDPRAVDYSEFNYQSRGGDFELTPYTDFTSTTTEFKTVTYKAVNSIFTMGGSAAYGITDNIEISGDLSFSSGRTSIEDCPVATTCTTESDRGMDNPSISTDFKFPAGPGAIRASLTYSFSPDDHEVDIDGDENRFTGGNRLEGNIGYEAYVGPHVFGGAFATSLMVGDRKVNDKTSTPNEITQKDGRAWMLFGFYEFHLPKVVIGGSVFYGNREATKDESGGTTTVNKDEVDFFGFQVYVPVYLSGGRITLLPNLSATSYDYKDSTTVKDVSSASLGFATRFTF